MKRIVEYQLAWHPNEGAAVRFRVEETSTWVKWLKLPAADFCAAAFLLNETKVFLDDNGAIVTGAEPVDE